MPSKTLVVGLTRDASGRKQYWNSDLVRKACLLAEKELDTQTRQGKKEFEHATRIAKNLLDYGFDNTTIAAGIVHELEEKAGTSAEKIALLLGKEVESIVTEYTKIREIEKRNLEKISREMLSTIILATAKDLRALFIKIVAKIETLQRSEGLSKSELHAEAKGGLHIYAPICQKLGLYELQALLEDNSLKIMKLKVYNRIKTLLGKTGEERNREVEKAIAGFSQLIGRRRKGVVLYGRAKSIYSIYEKIQQGRRFEEIYDLLGIRMVCNSIRECYELLGIVHSEYKTVPNQFTDYIANPKKNGYRSIHTAVFWDSVPIEVQIRTWEMHYEDETGLASHWQYKQYAEDRFFDKKLSWVKQLVEWHRASQEDGNLVHSLKMGFDQNRIFVFTPKQQVVVLPEGSSPIDFAFAIHSDLGRKCLKAKVNGKIVPLSHNLENADQVEIITGNHVEIKRHWLSFAKSHKAQAKIKQKLGIKPPKKKMLLGKKTGVLTSDTNTRIAKCCNPVPGDEIAGVRTTKRKISVHRAGCSNVGSVLKEKRLKINWDIAKRDYIVGIKVKARDSPGLLPAILKIISKSNAAISSTDAKTSKNKILQCRFNVKIKNIEQLDGIIGKIAGLPTVFEAGRE